MDTQFFASDLCISRSENHLDVLVFKIQISNVKWQIIFKLRFLIIQVFVHLGIEHENLSRQPAIAINLRFFWSKASKVDATSDELSPFNVGGVSVEF